MKGKIVIISIVFLVVIGVVFLGKKFAPSKMNNKEDTEEFILKKGDLVDSVLVSGTVVSSKSENVYAKSSNYLIKKVIVNVGDKVKAGDVLAILDTESLKLDIKQTELNLKNAEEALKNEEANRNYNLKTEKSNLESAKLDLNNAQKDYDEIKELYKFKESTKNQLSEAKSKLKKVKISYNNAKNTLNNIQSRNTTTAKNNIKIQKTMLKKQKKTLADTKIIAPTNGTVTLVNAKDMGGATGLLFVIEDTKNLIVSTAIGEYDVALVKKGQEVIIKADSTGDKQFKGVVKKIAPTAMKDINGDTDASSNIQFATDIALKDKNTNIKIGMNVRLTIIINEKKDVYSVPYDALIKETDEKSGWIYVLDTAKEQKDFNETKKIKVQTGTETDMYVEIISPELKDGLSVVLNPKDIQ